LKKGSKNRLRGSGTCSFADIEGKKDIDSLELKVNGRIARLKGKGSTSKGSWVLRGGGGYSEERVRRIKTQLGGGGGKNKDIERVFTRNEKRKRNFPFASGMGSSTGTQQDAVDRENRWVRFLARDLRLSGIKIFKGRVRLGSEKKSPP